MLVDQDSAFLELTPLAAYGSDFQVGASIVTGVGVISGVECLVIAHDPTVRGGSMNPYTLRKNLRAFEIARANRLPVVNLVESGGADLPTQADLFVPAGNIFRELTQLSARTHRRPAGRLHARPAARVSHGVECHPGDRVSRARPWSCSRP